MVRTAVHQMHLELEGTQTTHTCIKEVSLFKVMNIFEVSFGILVHQSFYKYQHQIKFNRIQFMPVLSAHCGTYFRNGETPVFLQNIYSNYVGVIFYQYKCSDQHTTSRLNRPITPFTSRTHSKPKQINRHGKKI